MTKFSLIVYYSKSPLSINAKFNNAFVRQAVETINLGI